MIYDLDEVKEITATRTPMKIDRPVCVTCNQTLALKNGVKIPHTGDKASLDRCGE